MRDVGLGGRWLKDRRKALDLTQAMLAARVGCATETIRHIEAGRFRPSREIADRLAEHLGVDAAQRQAFIRALRTPVANRSAESAARSVLDLGTPVPQRRYDRVPAPLTPAIGRAREAAAVRALLQSNSARLVTLVGPPGIGKTRLSLQVAADLIDHIANGVTFVSLTSVHDPALIATAMLAALGLKERGGQAVLDTVKEVLHSREVLLVLDNLEHVVAGAPIITEMLQAAPRLTVLATSRTPLHLYGEHGVAVPPLSMPEPGAHLSVADLAEYAAVALFVARARAVRADFELTADNAEAIAHICRRVDGNPLAIELAAAHIRQVAPQALLAWLEHPLAVLAGGPRDVPARHQDLRSAIAWSYDLLDAAEQRLFDEISVFVDGCTADSACAVCVVASESTAEFGVHLESLVEKSLLLHDDTGGQRRYRMLEVIRDYGQERLRARNEFQRARQRHLAHVLDFALEAEPRLRGVEQVVWLSRLEQEQGNIRAALGWALATGQAEAGARLANAVKYFWSVRGQWDEGYRWFTQILGLSGASEATRANALHGAGFLALFREHYAQAQACFEQSLTLARSSEDKAAIAAALIGLGRHAHNQGDWATARPYILESLRLSREINDQRGSAAALILVAERSFAQADFDEAQRLATESLALARAVDDANFTAWALGILAGVTRAKGDLAGARVHLEDSLAINRRIVATSALAWILAQLGDVSIALGDFQAATAYLEESLKLHSDMGHLYSLAVVLVILGRLAEAQQDDEQAREWYRHSLLIHQQQGRITGPVADGLDGLAGILARQGDALRAAHLLAAAAAMRRAWNLSLTPQERVTHERIVATTRRRLRAPAWREAWDQGQHMSHAQALDYALENS